MPNAKLCVVRVSACLCACVCVCACVHRCVHVHRSCYYRHAHTYGTSYLVRGTRTMYYVHSTMYLYTHASVALSLSLSFSPALSFPTSSRTHTHTSHLRGLSHSARTCAACRGALAPELLQLLELCVLVRRTMYIVHHSTYRYACTGMHCVLRYIVLGTTKQPPWYNAHTGSTMYYRSSSAMYIGTSRGTM